MSNPPDQPDQARLELLRTTCRPYPLDELVRHVAAASALQRQLYVERRDDDYYWSLVHGGGPYPLHREVARFLGVDWRRLVLGSRDVDSRWTALQLGPHDGSEPDAWAVIRTGGGLDEERAAVRINRALGRR
jgi:hypothetical protein